MRIALIGAPESGKSDLAAKLSDALGVRVVDGYAEALASETDLWIGYATTYVPNLLVCLERFKRELSDPDPSRITCGTMVDTMAYCAIHSAHVKEDSSPAAIDIDAIQAAVIMNSINFMMDENWRYDFVFYLPNKSERKLAREHDYALREVLATLSIDHTPLTDEDQFEQAVEVIWSSGK